MVIMMAHSEEKMKKKLNYQPSKLGRKGDPRMHAAMRARLIDTKLSLYDALKKGGFRFYSKSDGSVVDADNVSLSQRKNQLSRRIRLHKKHSQSEDGDETTTGGGGVSVTSLASYCNGSLGNEGYKEIACGDSNRMDQASYDVVACDATNFENLCATATNCTRDYSRAPNNDNHTNATALHEFQNNQLSETLHATKRPKKRRMSSFSVDIGQLEDPRLSLAIDNFRSEIAALFKKSMINAGYKPSETDECDPAYMSFVEKALQEESSRIQRMRSAMNRDSSMVESQGFLEDESGHHDYQQEQPKVNHKCSHNDSSIHPKSEGAKSEKKCLLHSRHFHRLEGKCGHQAIVHKPPGGNPHIDFVVNNKVECYEGCNPMMDYSAFWPSSFSLEEGAAAFGVASTTEEQKELGMKSDQEQESSEQIMYDDPQEYHHVQCPGDNCKPPTNDPKIFDLKDIDLTCGEWSKIFSEDDSSKSDEAALGTLFSLQKQSEL